MLKDISFFLIVFILIFSQQVYCVDSTDLFSTHSLYEKQMDFFWQHIENLKDIVDGTIRINKSGDHLVQESQKYQDMTQKTSEDIAPFPRMVKVIAEGIEEKSIHLEDFQIATHKVLGYNMMRFVQNIQVFAQGIDVTLNILNNLHQANYLSYMETVTNILKIYSQESIRQIIQEQLESKGYLEFRILLDQFLEKFNEANDMIDKSMEPEEQDSGSFLITFPEPSEDVQKELLGQENFNFLNSYEVKNLMEALYFVFYKS